MIKPRLFKHLMLVVLFAGLTVFSCESSDPDPMPTLDDFSSISVDFVAPDGTSFTFSGVNGSDGFGNTIELKAGVEYQVVVTVRSGSEDVTEAIKADGSNYQLFMIDSGDADTRFQLQDDVGLNAVLGAGPVADCKLRIILVEGLDKSGATARGNIRDGAGGVDRFSLEADLEVE